MVLCEIAYKVFVEGNVLEGKAMGYGEDESDAEDAASVKIPEENENVTVVVSDPSFVDIPVDSKVFPWLV